MSPAEMSPQIFRLRWPPNYILRISTWVFNKLCWRETKILTLPPTHTHQPSPPVSVEVAPSFTLLQFSCSIMSDSLRPHGLQHARSPCPSPTPRVTQTHLHRVSDAIQPSHPLLSPSPAFNLFQHQGLFQ